MPANINSYEVKVFSPMLYKTCSYKTQVSLKWSNQNFNDLKSKCLGMYPVPYYTWNLDLLLLRPT